MALSFICALNNICALNVCNSLQLERKKASLYLLNMVKCLHDVFTFQEDNDNSI